MFKCVFVGSHVIDARAIIYMLYLPPIAEGLNSATFSYYPLFTTMVNLYDLVCRMVGHSLYSISFILLRSSVVTDVTGVTGQRQV